jgi:hypothetical protein
MQFLSDNFGAISAIVLITILVLSAMKQGRIRSRREGDFYPVGKAEASGSVPPPNPPITDDGLQPGRKFFKGRLYKGVQSRYAALDIFQNNRFKVYEHCNPIGVWFTEDFEFACHYSLSTGCIIEFLVIEEIEIFNDGGHCWVLEVDYIGDVYYRFVDPDTGESLIKPVRFYSTLGNEIDPRTEQFFVDN